METWKKLLVLVIVAFAFLYTAACSDDSQPDGMPAGSIIVPEDGAPSQSGASRPATGSYETVPLIYDSVEPFSAGLAAVRYNGKSGYIDKNGNEVIPLKYDGAESFSEGLAAVCINDKWGFIDKSGNEVIPLIYESAGSEGFSEGLAAVSRTWDNWGYIDRAGNEIIPIGTFSYGDAFSGGVAIVTSGSWDYDKVERLQWGLIDKSGDMVVPFGVYAKLEPATDGMVWAATADRSGTLDRMGYLDNTGKEIVPLGKYDFCGGYAEGLAQVMVGDWGTGKWGFVDSSGTEVIQPVYDWVAPFSDGLALAYGVGFIDKTGNVVLPIDKYDSVGSFSEGVALIRVDGKWGFIDKTGSEVIPPILEYQVIEDVSEGIAAVRRDDKWGFISVPGTVPKPISEVPEIVKPPDAQPGSTESAAIGMGDARSDLRFGGHDWMVLDIKDGKALILSSYILEYRSYHGSMIDVVWASCSLRQYLNGEFYENTFSREEKSYIIETANVNPNNPWVRTAGGANTTDKVFLLSLEEVVRYFGDSGQMASGNTMSSGWIQLQPGNTWSAIFDEYDSARIARTKGRSGINGENWWLRTPGEDGDFAIYVGDSGYIDVGGRYVHHPDLGVRPAMWVDEKALEAALAAQIDGIGRLANPITVGLLVRGPHAVYPEDFDGDTHQDIDERENGWNPYTDTFAIGAGVLWTLLGDSRFLSSSTSYRSDFWLNFDNISRAIGDLMGGNDAQSIYEGALAELLMTAYGEVKEEDTIKAMLNEFLASVYEQAEDIVDLYEKAELKDKIFDVAEAIHSTSPKGMVSSLFDSVPWGNIKGLEFMPELLGSDFDVVGFIVDSGVTTYKTFSEYAEYYAAIKGLDESIYILDEIINSNLDGIHGELKNAARNVKSMLLGEVAELNEIQRGATFRKIGMGAVKAIFDGILSKSPLTFALDFADKVTKLSSVKEQESYLYAVSATARVLSANFQDFLEKSIRDGTVYTVEHNSWGITYVFEGDSKFEARLRFRDVLAARMNAEEALVAMFNLRSVIPTLNDISALIAAMQGYVEKDGDSYRSSDQVSLLKDILINNTGDGRNSANGFLEIEPQNMKDYARQHTVSSYTIEGSNYFKLRDIAAVLAPTGRAFNVGINDTAIMTAEPYQANGRELAKGDGRTREVSPSLARLNIDGSERSFVAYSIGGSYYFKLGDILSKLGIGYSVNEASNQVIIDAAIPHRDSVR